MGIILYDGPVKNCPFCGKEPIIVKDIRYPRPKCEATDAYEVICNTFGCPIYKADNTYFFSLEAAVRAWNERSVNGDDAASM